MNKQEFRTDKTRQHNLHFLNKGIALESHLNAKPVTHGWTTSLLLLPQASITFLC